MHFNVCTYSFMHLVQFLYKPGTVFTKGLGLNVLYISIEFKLKPGLSPVVNTSSELCSFAGDCDPTENFECRNGGTRSCPLCLECVSHASYKCDCAYGYRGVLCELEYSEFSF